MTNTELIELGKLGFALIQEIVKLVTEAHEGKVTAEDATAKVSSLHERLAEVNAATAGLIDAKFDDDPR